MIELTGNEAFTAATLTFCLAVVFLAMSGPAIMKWWRGR